MWLALVPNAVAGQDATLARLASSLQPVAVHLWFVNLATWSLGDDRSLLNSEESRRVASFVHSQAMRQYIRTHSALRRVLAAYVDVAPAELTFARGVHGRPYLSAGTAVDFNLSHSGDWMVLAVGQGCTVGVDIEPWHDSPVDRMLIGRIFSLNEAALWQSETPSWRERTFARIWTRKEATLKALGCGLIDDLSAIDAASEPALRLSLKRLRRLGRLPAGVAEGEVSLCDLVAPNKHAATLAIFGQVVVPTIFGWCGKTVQPWY